MQGLVVLLSVFVGRVYAQVDCSSLTVSSKSSYDTTCEGSLATHSWPVGVDSTYCHGWSAQDSSGKVQKYSAINLRCNQDSTAFLYTLHTGVTDCSASGLKVADMNFSTSCAATAGSNVFQIALDLSCCDQRSAAFANCNTGQPSVTWPTSEEFTKMTIYKNGAVCGAKKNTTTAPVKENTQVKSNSTTPAPTTATPSSGAASQVVVAISTGIVALLAYA